MVALKKAELDDMLVLQEICTTAYTSAFWDHWEANGLEKYVENQFGIERLKIDLKKQGTEYHFIQNAKEVLGFLKVNFRASDLLLPFDNCEIEKLYLQPKFSGKGIGQLAMVEIIDKCRRMGKEMIFLYVMDTNRSAIAFYEKVGFEINGKKRLEEAHFKEELRGMYRMVLRINGKNYEKNKENKT